MGANRDGGRVEEAPEQMARQRRLVAGSGAVSSTLLGATGGQSDITERRRSTGDGRSGSDIIPSWVTPAKQRVQTNLFLTRKSSATRLKLQNNMVHKVKWARSKKSYTNYFYFLLRKSELNQDSMLVLLLSELKNAHSM